MSQSNKRQPNKFFNYNVGRSALALLAMMIATSSLPALATDASRFSGNISYYGKGFNGRKTASGAKFDMNAMTCAHRTLPFGTRLLIENPKTGKSITVTVNDRGPFHGKRILDLAQGAAGKLGILLGGIAFVDVTVLGATTKSGKDDDDKSSYTGDTIGFLPEGMMDSFDTTQSLPLNVKCQILEESDELGIWTLK